MTKQLLHLVLGGELKDPTATEFVDLAKIDIVGLYPNYAEALKAWQKSVIGSLNGEDY